MSTFEAIYAVSRGKAEVRTVEYPQLPGDEFILVKAAAWALNPDDVYKLDLPWEETAGTRVGADVAGTVLEVGKAVTKKLQKGDRISGYVLAQNILRKHDGAFADVVAVKGDTVLKVPDSLSDEEAATQGVSVATMAQALYRGLELPLPETKGSDPFTLFIYGGSTAMGMAAIQFAKLSGGKVIATASPSNKEYLLSVGADHVLDYKSPTLVEDAHELAGGPVKLVFDAFSAGESDKISAQVLSRDGDGRYVGLEPGREKEVLAINPTVDAKSTLAYSAFGEPYWFEKEYFEAQPADLELQKSFVPVAEKLLAEGKVKTPRVFLNRGGSGLQGILKGLEELRAGNVRGGKLVYTPDKGAAGV
ncbi:GroES-like protein [Sarocladium strictum]